jgi:hypothetical protein
MVAMPTVALLREKIMLIKAQFEVVGSKQSTGPAARPTAQRPLEEVFISDSIQRPSRPPLETDQIIEPTVWHVNRNTSIHKGLMFG